MFCRFLREKKKEKERDELWRKLAELEISHRRREPSAKTNATGGVAQAKQNPPTLKWEKKSEKKWILEERITSEKKKKKMKWEATTDRHLDYFATHTRTQHLDLTLSISLFLSCHFFFSQPTPFLAPPAPSTSILCPLLPLSRSRWSIFFLLISFLSLSLSFHLVNWTHWKNHLSWQKQVFFGVDHWKKRDNNTEQRTGHVQHQCLVLVCECVCLRACVRVQV